MTYKIANRLLHTWDSGTRKCAPCHLAPCTRKIMKLMTHHPTGDNPLPCPKPCTLILMVNLAKVLEFPHAVLGKNLISCMVFSIAETAALLTPKD